MDTIIVNNQIYPIKLDSIRVQCITDFDRSSQTVEVANKKDNIFKVVSNDALFTTITTIIVFSLGILINIIGKKVERERHKRSIRTFIKQHLDNIVGPFSNRLQSAYNKIATETTIDSGITLTPPKILSNVFQRILHLDSKELFDSIKEKKELSNMIGQIDFLNNLIPEVQSYHTDALSKSNEFREKFNSGISHYMDSLAEFVKHEKNNTLSHELTEPYKIINASILKFYKEIAGQRELQKFYDEILRPNQEYLIKTKLFETHALGKQIAKQGKDLSHLFNELLILTEEFKGQYSEFYELIKSSTNSLKENMEKINWQ